MRQVPCAYKRLHWRNGYKTVRQKRDGPRVKIACLPFTQHWQTVRFTVWANGKRNSGLVNFVPESFAFIIQISSTCQKRPQRPETGTKDGLVEMEHGFPLVHMHSFRENRTTITLKKKKITERVDKSHFAPVKLSHWNQCTESFGKSTHNIAEMMKSWFLYALSSCLIEWLQQIPIKAE